MYLIKKKHQTNKKSYKINKKKNQPVAFIFKNKDLNTFKSHQLNYKTKFSNSIIRSDFISKLTKSAKGSRIIATTGFTSRELFQIRKE